MDELIRLVVHRTGLPRDQAAAAVAAVLEHLTTRLPSPVVGRIHELLRDPPQNASPPTPAPDP